MGLPGQGRRLLLVEDQRELLGLLERVFTDEGYAVDTAADGQRALHLGLRRTYDALVVDWGLPALDGVDVLRRLRTRGVTTPALILTARSAVVDRVAGLDSGAQAYLPKPFDIEELLARVRALHRFHLDRAELLPLPGGRRLDPAAHAVVGPDGRVELSSKESELLAVFARARGRVLTRQELADAVFPEANGPGVVDVYVHYLRRKLGKGLVRTVRGAGYRLDQP